MRPVLEAVIVNHNTSLFCTLDLRSLAAGDTKNSCDLRITVADNHSTDPDLPALKAACSDVGAEFTLSSWPAESATVNTHGDVLREFLLSRPDPDYFLFLDCDIDFDQPGTVPMMLEDIRADPSLWAVQARFHWSETHDGAGSSLNIWAGRPIEVSISAAPNGPGSIPMAARCQPRCHPGCALVRNIPAVRQVAERFGFGVAVVQSQDPEFAGLYDTLGLASAVLELQGYRYGLSRAAVQHFFNVSYQDDTDKDAACRDRLSSFA